MTPSRRTLLGAVAGASLVRGCAPVPAMAGGPDAELIALCAAYTEACRAGHASTEDATTDAAVRAQYDAMERIAPLRPRTAAGLRAKIGAACLAFEELDDFDLGDEEHLAMAALADVRDVLAMGA